jgi:hypothetical protein
MATPQKEDQIAPNDPNYQKTLTSQQQNKILSEKRGDIDITKTPKYKNRMLGLKILGYIITLVFIGFIIYLVLGEIYPNLSLGGLNGPIGFEKSTPQLINLYSNTTQNVSLNLYNGGSLAVQFSIYPSCDGVSLLKFPPPGISYDAPPVNTAEYNYTLNSSDYYLLTSKLPTNAIYNCSITIRSSSNYAGHFSTYGPNYEADAFKIALH